jgi:hypothetical protein
MILEKQLTILEKILNEIYIFEQSYLAGGIKTNAVIKRHKGKEESYYSRNNQMIPEHDNCFVNEWRSEA